MSFFCKPAATKHIKMVSKNELKYIQSLCHKKHRDEEKLFIAEGPKLAAEILQSDIEIKHLYATKEWLQDQTISGEFVTEVSDEDLKRMSNLQTPNKVFVIAKQKTETTEPLLKNNITIVLDGIQDPGNMGTIIRIADWFGLEQIVASEDCVDVYNPKVVQSTMGSICRVKMFYKNISSWIEGVKVDIYSALLTGTNVYSLNNIKEGLLVIGNESKGIREPLLSAITHPVTIPKKGNAESLNAAVATAIIVGCMVN